jgi:hypothetical protein
VKIATKTQPMMYIRRRPILSDKAPAIGAQIKPSQTYLKFPDQTAWVSLSVG